MKAFLPILCIFSFSICSAQDTSFFNANDKEVSALNECDYFEVVSKSKSDTNQVTEEAFYKSGSRKSYAHYHKIDKRVVYDTTRTDWYANGDVKWQRSYNNDGQYDGVLLSFWENGQKKRENTFEKNKLIEGTCWDEQGREVEYYDFVVWPQFPGGEAALFKWLGENMRYPSQAREAGIMGTVFSTFSVDSLGRVQDARILRGLGGGCDEEVLRLIETSPNWVPGFRDGEKAVVSFNLPVRFVLR